MSPEADQAQPAPPPLPSPVKPAAVAAPPGGAPAKPGQWAVPKPGGVCGVSGRAIAPGERFMAAVREGPTGIERVDVAAEHWDAADKSDMLASWQAVMPKGEEKKKLFVDDEVLCTLFERLAETTEPAKLAFRFVLGLILMRKRLVIYERTERENERDVWKVRMRGKEQVLDLIDPKLDEPAMKEVSQQLGEILHQEL